MPTLDQIISWVTLPFSWSRLQQLSQQDASRLSFIVITPLVVGTAVLLWRKGALGFKPMVALIAATLFVSWFLYSNVSG